MIPGEGRLGRFELIDDESREEMDDHIERRTVS
jgi:hypothetical protein